MAEASASSGALEEAARLLDSDPGLAKRRAEDVLKSAPRDVRALLVLGAAQRRLGQAAAARAVLEPLARAQPRAAHVHLELGLALAGLGEADLAMAALRQAVALQPAFLDAWRALEPLLADHLLAHPDDLELLSVRADAAQRLGRHQLAQQLLARCLDLSPDSAALRFRYAVTLYQRQKAHEAIAEAERLLALAPREAAYLDLIAACLGLVGEHDRAVAIYEALLADQPHQVRTWLSLGHALRALGRRDEAVAAYARCISIAPRLGEAYWSKANLKSVPFTPGAMAAMQRELLRPDLGDEDGAHLHYALGKALEDAGDHGTSFEHYAAGARLRRAGLPHDARAVTTQVGRSKALFTRRFFEDRADGGALSAAPIFIVGLPRSGSTLIEQILASHSAVEGLMELPEIPALAASLVGERLAAYPEPLAGLGAGERAALGERYLERTRIYRKSARPFFIDKMPNNFHHIGLIHLILPNAKIIDARRSPMGACFSAFKQHFASGHAFSYDQADLGRYYRDYVDLMAHWDAMLPGRVHRVMYEDMVADTEGQVRRLLEHCGLPFEAGCLRFYENDRAVRTASSEQVRRPIFRESLEQWRRYEPWLGPLKAALGPLAE